ncbi:MAG: 3-oxoacyl-ACP reductase FabG [Betaproteobacteria bacterium]|jgi:3-oxoacyl-[acyl-carrier protein] reductase|nr:3-oxoacyl-ACP reductase FabG [Betaproteobacteria bacterium]
MSQTSKVALVTGATRGIGQAIALALGQAGHTVIGTATTDEGAQSISQALSAHGLKGCGMVLQVNDAAACDGLLDQIGQQFGPIGILVNNAGITRDNLSMRMRDEEWDAVIQTNLTAVFRLSRGVLRAMMKSRWGRIINITSVVGISGNPGQMNYAAAKAGVAGMSRALAREVASRGITVNCVAPGFIDTDMTKSLSEDQIKSLTSQIPAQRLGTPADVASSVVFLASDGAAYITGVTLSVNGGMVMS